MTFVPYVFVQSRDGYKVMRDGAYQAAYFAGSNARDAREAARDYADWSNRQSAQAFESEPASKNCWVHKEAA